jgi:threonine synthase
MSRNPAVPWPLKCSNCGRSHPDGDLRHKCPTCGGVFDLDPPLRYESASDEPGGIGIERYRASFPLPPDAPWVSLGEGGTPLVAAGVDSRRIHFKCEYLNPTGSFKDRGSAVLVSALAAAGVSRVVEDSSGNAGASLAAYAARAGIAARIYVPANASPRKLSQIAAYGAELVRIPGPRTAVADAAAAEHSDGVVYASHAWVPLGLAGMASAAFEIVEQLGGPPGAVVVPAGQGTLLLGLWRGFQSMYDSGSIGDLPRMIGAQAAACAPLWAVHQGGGVTLAWVQEGVTRAEGIRILRPLRGDAVLEAVHASRGTIVAVDEPTIAEGEERLAALGFFVEPTSAVVWGALQSTLTDLPDPVVAVLTGSGLKVEPRPGNEET